MCSVDTRSLVPRNSRSHSSIASHRSSSGVRIHRSHPRQTTHNRPFSLSNASRRPTGNRSITSLVPSGPEQNRQVEYKRLAGRYRAQTGIVRSGPAITNLSRRLATAAITS